MASVKFTLNGKPQTVDVAPAMPLLWVLRDTLGMTGTKFGCGMALCGACTVHINGDAGAVLRHADFQRGRQDRDHHRRALARSQPSDAEGLDRRRTCRSAATASPARS